jgi:hypothetical protein
MNPQASLRYELYQVKGQVPVRIITVHDAV